jgi:hypothetical protein
MWANFIVVTQPVLNNHLGYGRFLYESCRRSLKALEQLAIIGADSVVGHVDTFSVTGKLTVCAGRRRACSEQNAPDLMGRRLLNWHRPVHHGLAADGCVHTEAGAPGHVYCPCRCPPTYYLAFGSGIGRSAGMHLARLSIQHRRIEM